MIVSKNGIALVVLIVEALLSALGVEFQGGTVEKAVEGILIAASLVMLVWNQFDREDIKLFILKK